MSGICVDKDFIRRLDRYGIARDGFPRFLFRSLVKSLYPVSLLSRPDQGCENADVLLLHPTKSHVARADSLAGSLRKRGMVVAEHVVDTAVQLAKNRMFSANELYYKHLPSRWRFNAAYAQWLVERYRPRVIVTFMDDSFLTPFLHRAANRSGGVLVNLAHAFCWPSMDFSMFDVDLFLVFGRTSEENLASVPVRFGDGEVREVGSIYLQDSALLGRGTELGRGPLRVLWLGQCIPESRRLREKMEKDLGAFERWIHGYAGDVNVGIRPHPEDRGHIRRRLKSLVSRCEWVSANEPLGQSLERFDVVLSSFSSATIESAAYGRPVVAFLHPGLSDVLGKPSQGFWLVRSEAELDRALQSIKENYSAAREAALALAKTHFCCLENASHRYAVEIEKLALYGPKG